MSRLPARSSLAAKAVGEQRARTCICRTEETADRYQRIERRRHHRFPQVDRQIEEKCAGNSGSNDRPGDGGVGHPPPTWYEESKNPVKGSRDRAYNQAEK